MATLSLAGIADALSLVFQDRLIDQFRRDVVVLAMLDVVPGRNGVLTWPAKFDGRSNAGAYAEGADLDDANIDSHDRDDAVLSWAQYRCGAKVSGLAEAVAQAGGYAGGASVIMEELQDGIDELITKIGADIYAGNPGASPVQLAGAALAIDGSDGTFAGLANTTYDGWRSGEATHALDSLNVKAIREKLIRPVKDATGRRPDFATCAGDIWDAVASLADEQNVYRTTQVRGAQGMVDIEAMLGQTAIVVDGVPIIEDRHATASTMYGWSSKHVKVRTLPGMKPAAVDYARLQAVMREMTQKDVPIEAIRARVNARGNLRAIVPTIEYLAKTGDADKFQIKTYLQMQWDRRNAFSKLTLT